MAWARMCGGAEKAPSVLLSQLDTLARTSPSSTSAYPDTKRTWTKNSIISGLTEDNYFSTTGVTSFTTNGNSCTYYNNGAYGVGLVTNCVANKTYSIKITASGQRPKIMYYAEDGTYIGRFNVSNDGSPSQFTPPSNAEYVLVLVYNTSTGGTFTLNELKIAG